MSHKKKSTTTPFNTASWKPRKSCHSGPVEIIPNFFLATIYEANELPALGVTTLVPLDSLYGNIWRTGFRGEILYYPIQDYDILPDDVLQQLVDAIVTRLSVGVKVGLFCMGGHGRTGYIAATVLGALGYDDPIGFIRQHYCSLAIETNEQVEHIAHVLDKPELCDRYVDRSDYYKYLQATSLMDNDDWWSKYDK
jgi:hypothetical protein